jgi:hypothetical protein
MVGNEIKIEILIGGLQIPYLKRRRFFVTKAAELSGKSAPAAFR